MLRPIAPPPRFAAVAVFSSFALFAAGRAGATVQLAWTADVPGTATVTLAGGLALVDADTHVQGYELATGKRTLDVDVGAPVRQVSADGRSIAVVAGEGALAVLDPVKGVVRFRGPAREGYASALAAGEHVIAVRKSGVVEALSATDGTRVWRQLLSGRPGAPPSLGEGAVFVSDDTFVHALARTDGQRRWRFGLLGAGTPVALDKGVALAATRPRFATALDEGKGDLRWTYGLVARAT